MLLRPLPYKEPGQLVTIQHSYPSLHGLLATVSAPGFAYYREHTRSFSGLAVQAYWAPNLVGIGEPEQIAGSKVSGQYFRVTGVSASLGRPLVPAEDVPGTKVVVLSDGLWKRYGADPHIVGRRLLLDDESYEVVGVMPPGFRDFFRRDTGMWTPLGLSPEALSGSRSGDEYLNLVARLKPLVTVQEVQRELTAMAEQIKQDSPDEYPSDWTLAATSLGERSTGAIRSALLALLGAVSFVLLIACANVANLLFARGSSRSKELAVRTALGVRRGALLIQLLTENLLLALIGGVLGVAVAWIGIRALGALSTAVIPGEAIRIDSAVLLFSLVLSIITGFIFGLLPAWQTTRLTLQDVLRDSSRGAVGSRGTQSLRRTLVAAEIALALILLTGAGLLIRSFARLHAVNPGFEPSGVLAANVALPRTRYPSDTAQAAFFEQVLTRLNNTPGIVAAAGETKPGHVRPPCDPKPQPWG